ncbi:ATP-binding cassette sub-family D member-like isoform X3 [Vespa mandarinia]|uniref:ATP-binding cassette sub-family D member-like isoform X3 n=1 Tax=Vespa mandarinia TaxID=7446 RepID=UPI001616FABA|nr:ATP-binding cassette sub-family D member-like isoform X3 [Vespa mandarinia]
MSIFSKLIDKTSNKYGIRQERLTHGVAGVVTVLYFLKIGYPFLVAKVRQRRHRPNTANEQRKDEDDRSRNDSKRRGKNKNDRKYNRDEDHRYDDDDDGDDDHDEDDIKSIDIKEKNNDDKAMKKEKIVGLDRAFLKQLITLLRIMVPSWRSKESGLLACATLTLLARTFLSVYVATLEGQIVKRIVLKDIRGFIYMMARWFAIAFPATFVNSAIRYLEGRLALNFRERLVEHAYKMYLSQQTYYRVVALDTRLGGLEQRLTDDLSELASSVAHLYSSLTKPLLDCALVGIALISFSLNMGARTIPGPLLALVVITLTGQVLRLASPRFGQLVAEEATRRGRLREAHARISAHAEEIAFYGGHQTEHRYLTTAYKSLVTHLRRILAKKLWYVMLEQFLMKYLWSGTGLVLIALPLLYNSGNDSQKNGMKINGDVSERTRYLTTSKNLLMSGADAVERLMVSYKELVALAGYAGRVNEMFEVFKDAALCKYQRNVVVNGASRTNNGNTSHPEKIAIEFKNGNPVIKGIVRESNDGSISLINVPIVTPNCEIIVPSLTMTIRPGDHLLITGPNGCGKSSLFRIISGLWPVYDGTLIRPNESYTVKDGRPSLFYIPQKPYMTVGCLRDQIIYPAESETEDCSDEELMKLLDEVDLKGLVEREPDGLNALGDWDSTLSGGEKQRLAITRLFYHAPQYALLDECTSAVSIEAEGIMYETAKKRGITLLTITHRLSSLSKYHKLLLRFDGEGSWTLGPLENNVENVVNILNHNQTKDNDNQLNDNIKTGHYQMLHVRIIIIIIYYYYYYYYFLFFNFLYLFFLSFSLLSSPPSHPSNFYTDRGLKSVLLNNVTLRNRSFIILLYFSFFFFFFFFFHFLHFIFLIHKSRM